MSRRASIVNALAQKFKTINGTGQYVTNLFGNAFPTLKFWDEVADFPSVYIVTGTETREYHPSGFTWGFLGISLKLYCYGEDPQEQLESLIEDIENCINANRVLEYDPVKGLETTEILVQSITTDEGLLVPYSVGEINLLVRYALQ